MKKAMLATLVLTGGWFFWTFTTHTQVEASPRQDTTSTSKDNEASVDQDISLLRQDLRSKKKQLIAANLKLTDAEATKFWPVYDQYTAESSKLGDQKYALLKEYAQGFGTLTNEQALSLTNRSLALDEQTAQLRSKYVPIVKQVLPGTKTATFFQIDRRISELIDLQLATGIPLAQEQN
jgi:predicted transposase YdaD